MQEIKATILVTGGAGFVGSALIPLLLGRGYNVRVVDNLMYGHGETLLPYFAHQNFSFVEGDIRNEALMKELLASVDTVVHLAAIVGYPACRKNERLAYEVNVVGTENIAKNVSPRQQMIFTSTGSNYGSVNGICTEETPLHPLTVYGKTKTAAEHIAFRNTEPIVYRFATGFGIAPRLRLDLMINDFVYQALHAKNLIVYEKDFRRTFIHVRDMAASIVFAVENYERMRNHIFNVGSEYMNLTKEDVAKKIRERLEFYLHFANTGKDEDQRDYAVSYKKIEDVGFHTVISLDEGLSELINAFKIIKPITPYNNLF